MSTMKLKPLLLSVLGAFVITGCAGLEPAWRVEPDYKVESGGTPAENAYRLGRFYQAQMNYDRAIAAYRAALALDPRLHDAQNAIGVIQAAQGRYNDAIGAFRAAIAIAPHAAYLRNNLGYALLQRGAYDEAVASLEAAAAADPGNQRISRNLELARNRAGTVQPAPSASGARGVSASVRPSISSEPIRPVSTAIQMRPIQDDGARLIEVAPHVYELKPDVRPIEGLRTAAQTPPAHAQPFRLEISNGNGVTGMAARLARELTAVGQRTWRLTNQPSFDRPATQIQYRDRYGTAAEWLAEKLRSRVPIVRSNNLSAGVDVRLVLGRDVRDRGALLEIPSGRRVASSTVSGKIRPAATGRDAAAPRPFTLEVSNGNGVTGMAKRVASYLGEAGQNTQRLTNQLPFAQRRTEIQYRPNWGDAAGELASLLHPGVPLTENDTLSTHVRLVLGHDFRTETALLDPRGGKRALARTVAQTSE